MNTWHTETPGHRYHLFNQEDTDYQTLQFVEKIPKLPGSVELETYRDGTTNEEVIAVLIDRINFLNKKFPCRENSIALTHIETALLWLNKRSADRINRRVEGTAQA